eukprot:TRINITY_DN2703_c0_g1_i4.p1 TRINITY_DN2703_c0_g1~~TRINITY_DN2703_c0_g1_i4.p1  ORF type:complete len:341 (-),score=66.80 TRINITY_DN2703_c0_g1_i4:271-1293(-)
MDYGTSSQYRQFIFTAEQLAEKRKVNNERAIEEANKLIQKENQAIEFLTVEEELTLLRFYESKIQEFCRKLRIPRRVLGVAMIFFKRYYIRYSVMEKDPLNLMMTSIYVACKTMDNYISAGELCKLINRPPALILSYEISLLESMDFCLFIFTAEVAAIEGMVIEFQKWQASDESNGTSLKKATEEQLAKVKGSTYSGVECLMRSDAPLMYSHSKIALAAFRSGFQRLKLDQTATNFDPFLKHISGNNEEILNQLKKALQALDVLGAQGATFVKQEDVKEVDRRMKMVLQIFMKEEKEKKSKNKKRKQSESDQKSADGSKKTKVVNGTGERLSTIQEEND